MPIIRVSPVLQLIFLIILIFRRFRNFNCLVASMLFFIEVFFVIVIVDLGEAFVLLNVGETNFKLITAVLALLLDVRLVELAVCPVLGSV